MRKTNSSELYFDSYFASLEAIRETFINY